MDRLVGAASGLMAAEEELAGGGDRHTKRKKMANSTYDQVGGLQVSGQKWIEVPVTFLLSMELNVNCGGKVLKKYIFSNIDEEKAYIMVAMAELTPNSILILLSPSPFLNAGIFLQTKVPCRQRGRPRLLSSKMAQLKQKANTKHESRLESIFGHREKPSSGSSAEQTHRNISSCQSETGILTSACHWHLPTIQPQAQLVILLPWINSCPIKGLLIG